MREEHRTSLIRGAATGVLTFGVSVLGTHIAGLSWDMALSTGGIDGMLVLGAFYGLGIHDARRNDAKPSDA